MTVKTENINELDDAALEKIISESPVEQDTVKEKDNSSAEQVKSEVKKEPEVGKQEVKQESKQEPKTETPPTNDPKAELEKIRLENEKLKKQVNEKENFLQRQANELGELRKKTAINKDEIRDKFVDDPMEALRQIREAEDAERRIKEIEADTWVNENKRMVTTANPDFDTLIDPMAEILKKDGIPDNLISEFKTNPFRMANAETLIQIVNRAKLTQEKNLLTQENEKLKSEIEQLKNKTANIAENIQRVARESNVIKAGSWSSTKSGLDLKTINEESVSELSDAMLDELIKQEG